MKETINIFEILGEKKEPQLDVFEILNVKSDDSQLDELKTTNNKTDSGKAGASEILSNNVKKNQEQKIAPDFDLYQSTTVKAAPEPLKPAIQATPPKPAPKPEPLKPAPESAPQKPEPAPKPEPLKPAPAKPATKPEPPKPAPEPAPQKLEPVPKPEQLKPAKRRRFSLVRLIIKLAAFVIIAVLLFTFVVGLPKISMNSMEPMISDGDHVIISKLAKDFRKNDIVVFKGNDGSKLAARIVAVKGDVVSLNNIGGLYVNNKLQEEEYVHTVTTITDTAVSYPVIVDEDSYFVLGDNRTDSVDSRNSSIGLIENDRIEGKVIFCFKKIK